MGIRFHRLADQQRTRFERQQQRACDQHKADHQTAQRIEHLIVKQNRKSDAAACEAQADQGERILHNHRSKLSGFGVAPEPKHSHTRGVRAVHALIGLLDTLVQAVAFENRTDYHHDERDEQFHPVHITQCRVLNDGDELLDRFGRREESADEKQQRGHDERCQIFGTIQAKRMVAIGLAPGEPAISTISLEQSAMECTDSDSMADDPVKNAAQSFAMVTPMFAPNAALTAAP